MQRLNQRFKELVINNKYPQKEIQKTDLSELLVMLYSHIPFALVSINLENEYELLDFITEHDLQSAKIRCSWKNARIHGFRAMKANKDVLYLMAFSETAIYSRDKIKDMLPIISAMMDEELIKNSAMLIYRLQENNTDNKPDMSLQYDIYDKTGDTNPLSQEHIVYRSSVRGLYIRNYLARLMNEYIAISHSIYESPREKQGYIDVHHFSIESSYYAFTKPQSTMYSMIYGPYPYDALLFDFNNVDWELPELEDLLYIDM